MPDKDATVSIRAEKLPKYQYRYHVIVNGKIEKTFAIALVAEAYVHKNYGHIPLIRRDY